MKLVVHEVQDVNIRKLLYQSDTFVPSTTRNVTVVLEEAFAFALSAVIGSFFSDAFGVSKMKPVVNGRLVSQRIKCSGRNVRMAEVDGRVVPVEDKSAPDRTFEIVVELPEEADCAVTISGMKIKSVEIENYRAIVKQKFNFNAAGNRILLFGLNGSGKTSAIEACMLALGGRLDFREPPDQDYSIRLEIVDAQGRQYEVLKTPVNHLVIEANGVHLATSESEVRRMFERSGLFFFSSWRAPMRLGGVNLRVRGVRRSPMLRDNETLPTIKTYLVNKFVYDRVQESFSFYENFDLLTRLNEAWKMFYPEEDGVFFVERKQDMRSSDPAADLRFDVYLRRKKDSAPVSVDDLSAGELEIFCMLGVLLIQAPAYDLVFIDEPELHLNRVWHRTILEALEQVSPTTQFLVTTHSPEVLASVYPRQRFCLGPNAFAPSEDGGRADRVDEEVCA